MYWPQTKYTYGSYVYKALIASTVFSNEIDWKQSSKPALFLEISLLFKKFVSSLEDRDKFIEEGVNFDNLIY
jgi:hypothetical protein